MLKVSGNSFFFISGKYINYYIFRSPNSFP